MINSNGGAITLTGRIVRDPRFNTVQDSKVANFTIAFSNGVTPKMATVDGREQLVYVDSTSYIGLAAWDTNATDADTLEKGQEVTVDVTSIHAKGRVHEGKQFADVHGRATNIRAGAKAKNTVPNPGASSDARGQQSETDFNDSIPF